MMKKFVAVLALIAATAVLGQATTIKLLSGRTTTGAGTAVVPLPADKTYQASGSTSAGTGTAVITVECSILGSSWNTLGTATLTLGTVTTSQAFTSKDRCTQIRGNVTSITGTSTINLTAGY